MKRKCVTVAYAKKDKKEKKRPAAEIIQSYAVSIEHGRVPTDILSLDYILGGGFVRGKWCMVSSPEAVGKSTMALHVANSFCFQGESVKYIDAEGALNSELTDGVGLDEFMDKENPANPDALFQVAMLDTMDDIDDYFGALLEMKKKPGLVVIDSWNHVQPSIRKDVKVSDVRPGVKATQDGIFLPKYKNDFLRAGISVLLIAQKRASFAGWQPTYDPAVSNAVKFAMDTILEIKLVEKFKDDNDVPIGSLCEIVADPKNKMGGPCFVPKPMHIVFKRGVSNLRTATSLLMEGKVSQKEYEKAVAEGTWEGKNPTILQAGAYYTPNCPEYRDENDKGLQGFENLCIWVSENFGLVVDMLKERGIL